ncbi:MAG: DUF1376 domain-containing protein [Proteobacteria bacterium]|uniref:DUF1376 domain-containing protein n=1 Tax=Candidatus Fonsibacter lacus TaxID=2576439 RepID=A0A964XRU1_9PROT|nr:DUF1376 domain-containing protein [Candidatus Fonsibacter lacus]NBP60388.1 DUF1376 domain-containing protein [Pseudomonadota bacterium]NCU72507.1 DUF1376 domain-containing protein [Candidatus Fonsibacter lacus]
MASKDPAALFYIDKWLIATAEMDADTRGWYLNLILHQYDKKSLPDSIESLAVLANVKFSEYERFKQVFEQVLKQKFIKQEDGRLRQEFAAEVIQGREKFTEKRELSGRIGYVIKIAKGIYPNDYKYYEYLKKEVDFNDIDTKDEQVLKQMLKQMHELYININKDIIISSNNNKEDKREKSKLLWNYLLSSKQWIDPLIMKHQSNTELMTIALKDFFVIQNLIENPREDAEEVKKHFANWLKTNPPKKVSKDYNALMEGKHGEDYYVSLTPVSEERIEEMIKEGWVQTPQGMVKRIKK